MSKFNEKSAEKAGWHFVHHADAVYAENGGIVRPETFVAEKYVNDSMIHEEAQTKDQLLTQIENYERKFDQNLVKPIPAPVSEEGVKSVILPAGKNKTKAISEEEFTAALRSDTIVTPKKGTVVTSATADVTDALEEKDLRDHDRENKRVEDAAKLQHQMGSQEYAEADLASKKTTDTVVVTPQDKGEKSSTQVQAEAFEKEAKKHGALADKPENIAKAKEAGGKAAQQHKDKAEQKAKSKDSSKSSKK